MSTRLSAAEITTAARAVVGTGDSSPGTATSSSTMHPAPTSPVTWVFEPACSATGVRVAEPLDENPPTNPAARLTAPRAPSSWSGSTCSPRRNANECEITLVSANEMSAIAMAVGNRVMRSPG